MSRFGFGLRRWLIGPVMAASAVMAAGAAHAGDADGLPEIRLTGANRVPACVTPERLMAFVSARHTKLPAKFSKIAWVYRDLGEATLVRWDYAFFQMILETNYLMYRRGDGSSGDVGQTQNNFAGIGATGGGVPGDQYGDVRTGVLAHMQHLVAYSGERVERPVAARTREVQHHIIEISRKLGRRVTFSDLSRRWAVDRAYGRNIETVAQMFRRAHCATTAQVAPTAGPYPRTAFAAPSRLGVGTAEPLPPVKPATALVSTVWRRGAEIVAPAPRPAVPRSGVTGGTRVAEAGAGAAGMSAPSNCQVHSASYGGSENVLIKSRSGADTLFTAVTVEADQRRSMAMTFISAHAPGGEIVGHYDSKDAALSAARGMCRAN